MFGNNLAAHEKFLDGVEFGPGGLKQLTADEQGLGVSARVGMRPPFVEAGLGAQFDPIEAESASCVVALDASKLLGIVINDRDEIMVYLIGNPVVRTAEELGIGSTLRELQGAYDLQLVQMEDGSRLAMTAPRAAIDPITGTEPARSMVFELDPQGVVIGWRVGATSRLQGSALCP